MNNSLTSLAFTLHSNKGVYALLLGSGISRNSGIPTGWDIVLDLINKLAVLNNENCLDDPIAWFVDKYGEDPDYSTILSKLVSTPSERVNLMKKYFEATDEEKRQGLKKPSIAHKSIAKLAKKGILKVVITTNFDRLLEVALRDEGIEPIVIKHMDDIDGALPLVHSQFTLIKINGDYLDCRFLNTRAELEEYPDKLKNYLLRIIDEFGMISCGWSGKWDIGLNNILTQSNNFRFASYWTFVNCCEEELQGIANYRKGKTLQIQNADNFFSELYEKIEALEKINGEDPVNIDIAIARLKKYIANDDGKIMLYDLLRTEQEKAYDSIFSIDNYCLKTPSELRERLDFYEQSIDMLLSLSIHGVYWSTPVHEEYFVNILKRLSEPVRMNSTYTDLCRNCHYYPALVLFYAMGLIALKRNNFSLLKKFFTIKISDTQEQPCLNNFIKRFNSSLLDSNELNMILSKNYHTPLSTYLNLKLQKLLNVFIYTESEFNELFQVFEYLLSINYQYIVNKDRPCGWVPVGEFRWRQLSFYNNQDTFFKTFFEKAELEKENWAPIKQGMFGSSYKSFLAAKSGADEHLNKIYFH